MRSRRCVQTQEHVCPIRLCAEKPLLTAGTKPDAFLQDPAECRQYKKVFVLIVRRREEA